MSTNKVFQILQVDNTLKTIGKKLCNINLYDVFVTPLNKRQDKFLCKVIYYKETPKIIPNLYIGKRLWIHKNLLVPTKVFPRYAYNTSLWIERVNEFYELDNVKEIVKSTIVKSGINSDIQQYLISKLSDINNLNEVTSFSISPKRVRITSKLIRPGRVFINPRVLKDKIKIIKVYGNTVYYTIDTDIKKIKSSKILDMVLFLNKNKYEVYPFWVDLIKDFQRILKPYLGGNLIAWIIDWLLNQIGVSY